MIFLWIIDPIWSKDTLSNSIFIKNANISSACPKKMQTYLVLVGRREAALRLFRFTKKRTTSLSLPLSTWYVGIFPALKEITTVLKLFSAISVGRPPNFFLRGWGSHFWGPRAPKSEYRVPEARGLRKFLGFYQIGYDERVLGIFLENWTLQKIFDQPSWLVLKSGFYVVKSFWMKCFVQIFQKFYPQ